MNVQLLENINVKNEIPLWVEPLSDFDFMNRDLLSSIEKDSYITYQDDFQSDAQPQGWVSQMGQKDQPSANNKESNDDVPSGQNFEFGEQDNKKVGSMSSPGIFFDFRDGASCSSPHDVSQGNNDQNVWEANSSPQQIDTDDQINSESIGGASYSSSLGRSQSDAQMDQDDSHQPQNTEHGKHFLVYICYQDVSQSNAQPQGWVSYMSAVQLDTLALQTMPVCNAPDCGTNFDTSKIDQVPSSHNEMNQDANSYQQKTAPLNFVNTGDQEQFDTSHGGSYYAQLNQTTEHLLNRQLEQQIKSLPMSQPAQPLVATNLNTPVSNKESKFDTSTLVRKSKKNKKAKKVVPPSPSKSSDNQHQKVPGSASSHSPPNEPEYKRLSGERTYIEVPVGITTSGGAPSLEIEFFQADRARYGQKEIDMSTLKSFAKRTVSLSDLSDKKQKEGYHYLTLKEEFKGLKSTMDTRKQSYFVKIGDGDELFFLYCETSKADNVQNIITLDDQGRFHSTRYDDLNTFAKHTTTPDVSNA